MIFEDRNIGIKFVILAGIVLLIAGCGAQPTPDINEMMDHLRANYPAIIALLKASAFMIGIWFIYNAVHKLRAFGEVRTMMPSNAEFSGPMLQFFIGVLLVWLPTFINISAYSLWGTNSILNSVPTSGNWASVEKAALGMIKIFGYIAFIRGLTLMAKGGNRGAPQGTFGKGMIHLIGGIFAIHIEGTINVIMASFGFLT